ncbi:MAG TPA: 4-alpha-glucanotransferase [Woeseiaceae bacterium]
MNNSAVGDESVLKSRSAGIILHPTSLPDGRIGNDAFRFAHFLSQARCQVWQVLPLGPTGQGRSPYSPVSVFAGNPQLLPVDDESFGANQRKLTAFIDEARHWLPDFALFTTLKQASRGAPWWQWPIDTRNRRRPELQRLQKRYAEEIAAVYREQYRFAGAWQTLRAYANARGILLYGDLPMFPVTDSADVWTHRELFKLDAEGVPTFTAGVPPDAFAEDGQHWGNPVFDWHALQDQGFLWWRQRVRHELQRFDLLRWDHFRGLVETWEIPHGARTAREGQWREVPGRELLTALRSDLGPLPLIAENLGIITPQVEQLRRDFGLPGMHVLQFAFDGSPDNPHRPDNHEELGVAYTGTHDNDTTLGWFQSLTDDVREQVLAVTGGKAGDMPWPAVGTVFRSRSRLAVVPMQDLLALDSRHRMNRPGVAEGNWGWQVADNALGPALAERIRDLVTGSNRNLSTVGGKT